jgi:hypothetical protein
MREKLKLAAEQTHLAWDFEIDKSMYSKEFFPPEILAIGAAMLEAAQDEAER